MNLPFAKLQGYLLIELCISLVFITLFSLLMARFQASLFHHGEDTKRYIKVVTYIERLFEEQRFVCHEWDGCTIETAMRTIDARIPYRQVTVTASFKTADGRLKKIVIQGGILNENQRV